MGYPVMNEAGMNRENNGGLRLDLEKLDEVRLMQPAVLAFMGDAVFELFIRERLIRHHMGTSHQLHIYATHYVKASRQAKIARSLQSSLTAEIRDYRYATAFEALLGYLYLTDQQERLHSMMEQAAIIIDSDAESH
mgnify:CR=1 FL=1